MMNWLMILMTRRSCLKRKPRQVEKEIAIGQEQNGQRVHLEVGGTSCQRMRLLTQVYWAGMFRAQLRLQVVLPRPKWTKCRSHLVLDNAE